MRVSGQAFLTLRPAQFGGLWSAFRRLFLVRIGERRAPGLLSHTSAMSGQMTRQQPLEGLAKIREHMKAVRTLDRLGSASCRMKLSSGSCALLLMRGGFKSHLQMPEGGLPFLWLALLPQSSSGWCQQQISISKSAHEPVKPSDLPPKIQHQLTPSHYWSPLPVPVWQ